MKVMHDKRTSIRMRILRLALISVGVAIVSLMLVLTLQLDYVSLSGYKNELQSLSEAYTNTVQASAATIKMQLEAAAKNDTISTSSSAAILKWELEKLASTTSFHDFSIANMDGTTLNNTDISDREYFQQALAGNTYISRPVLRKTDNSLVIMAGSRMPNGKVLYGAVNSDALSTGLSSEFLGEGGFVHVVNKYNEIVASSNAAMIGQSVAYDLTVGAKDIGKDLVSYVKSIEGTDGWHTIVVGNTEVTHQAVANCLYFSIPICAALCGLAVGVALLVSKRIATPLKTTTRRLTLLARGDLSADVEVFRRHDETEDISKALRQVCDELNSYVSNIVNTTQEMANGDFTYSQQMNYLGDFESIPTSFTRIHNTLEQTITNLNLAATSVKSGTEQIATGAQALAEGTARQATSVDTLTNTLESISSAVEHTAKNAEKASDLSIQCAEMMQTQNKATETLLQAIETIEHKSEDISGIIKVIEDIAFQTNILALNASIEAARAGEVGKGFAVVAAEVGSLAAKSAESANSTKELLSSTLAAVKISATHTKDTAQAIQRATELSSSTAALVKDIASDADNQAQVIKQAAAEIESIAQVVQQNSATAEESAASCEELSAQALTLAEHISQLKA